MRINPASQSGAFNPRIFLAFILCSAAVLLAVVNYAANPDHATVTPSSAKITWVGTAPGGASANEASCVEGATCETFTLTIDGTKADWLNKQARVVIKWDDEVGATDYDLYIHKGPLSGPIVGQSAGSDNPEAANLNPNDGAVDVGVGVFSVHIVYFSATAATQYTGEITVIDAPPPPPDPPALPPPPPATPGVSRYYNYSPPAGIGENAGEPTVGFNLTSKKAMFISGLQTLRVTFPDAGACDGLWEDVSYVLTSKKSLDPILFTDQGSNRTFVSQLNSVVPPASPVLIGLNSLMAFTDDDGATWTPAQVNPPDGSYDHQNVGGGAYPASVPLGNPVNKDRAVYYCSQAGVTAFCSRSDDGGLNFGPSRAVYTIADGCGGIHGHVKVAPDGTVYLPVRGCNDVQSVVVSEDAGVTWEVRQVKGTVNGTAWEAKPPPGILDPSIGIASDGTLYFAYIGAEGDGGRARVAVSHDKGLTWINDAPLGDSWGLKNMVFANAQAGDPGRAAVLFLGTTAPGNHQGATFKGTWYVFAAHTYDGGQTWTTVNVTPDDPVQREACIWNGGGANPCRNLLDFNGITMDDKGRVLYSYADGCVNECVTGPPNSYSAKATIARQAGGRGLLAAHDAAEPILPQAACLSGRRDDLASYLRWKAPDNGGAEITSYKIFRGPTPGTVNQLVGQASGAKTAFTDRSVSVSVSTYYYKVVAQNSQGEGAASNVIDLTIGPRVEPNATCALPGVQVLVDPLGDTQFGGQPQHDITSVSMAEPESLSGKVAFIIKVANLAAPIPPNFRWAVRFGAPQAPPPHEVIGAQEDWFVSMVTSDGAAPTFTYGTTGVFQGASRVFVTLGNLDPASNFNPDGTITLVLPKSAIGNPQPGQALSSLFGSVRATVPSAIPGTGGTNETIPDSTGTGSYALRSANLCLPNTAPLARLTADRISGPAPLTVTFNGANSSDPDSIDNIASYTFNFGDGTDDVVQNSPTITHTFTEGGFYSVKLVVTDSRGKLSSNFDQQLIEVTPAAAPSAAQLLNISSRLRVQTGDNILIGGFIVTGSDPKRVILRAIGPSTGIPGLLVDPTLELHDGTGALLASNDNWKDSPERSEIETSGVAPSDDRESVIIRTLNPGPYTAVLRGASNTTGLAVVEAYDGNTTNNSKMANLSTRGFVETGNNILIGGFITGNRNGNINVLVRAIGPSLNGVLPNALANPVLELHNGNGATIAVNDNWQDSQKTDVEATGIPPSHPNESAIVSSLVPGNYTAIVRGVNNTMGNALVEVYNLP